MHNTTIHPIEPSVLKKELASARELALVDVREQGQYGEGHPFHAVPLAYSQLELNAKRLIPNLSVQIVVLDSGCGDTLGVRAASRLQAMGYQHVTVLNGGAAAWHEAGYTLFKGVHVPSKTLGELVEINSHTPRISAMDLKLKIDQGDDMVILDGRSRSEYAKMNIPGAICCPNAEIPYRLHRLAPDPKTTVVVNCAGRTRSIIGAQSLVNLGIIHRVFALENGTQGWYLNELALEHQSERFYPEVFATDAALESLRPKAALLAKACHVQHITAEQLEKWLEDTSRTTYVFDVRTPEEFRAGSLHGAIHAEGGQLLQGTDLYMAVRHARVVLLDVDGIRAPLVGSWLFQMGFEVFLLPSVVPKLALHAAAGPQPSMTNTALAELPRVEIFELSADAHLLDLRPSLAYRAEHLRGAVWSTRSRIRAQVDAMEQSTASKERNIVLVTQQPEIAALAASELSQSQRLRTQHHIGDSSAWKAAGWLTESTPDFPADADCLDYLFFVHDRHEGNKQAAMNYLEWEMNLVSQLDAQEKSSFRLYQPTKA